MSVSIEFFLDLESLSKQSCLKTTLQKLMKIVWPQFGESLTELVIIISQSWVLHSFLEYLSHWWNSCFERTYWAIKGKYKNDLCVVKIRIVWRNLTHFISLVSFTPWKHQKAIGFLMFSGGIQRDQWYEMDQKDFILKNNKNLQLSRSFKSFRKLPENRSSHQRCSVKTCNFIKKETQHRWFSVNFAKFLRTSFLQNSSGRLLLRRDRKYFPW